MYCCFKRNLIKEIKVVQLAGYVGEHGAYHHGEASLLGAIIGMAQDFVGSNNINLLVPSGQFGSRNLGGDDSAQARYIFTYITPIVHYIFHKADTDLYTYNLDDGEKIEPMFYAPIIPMILVNGCSGIGTGWSSFIPQFNPIDIIANLYNMMSNSPLNSMTPWYRGFSGTIMKLGPNQWITKGTYILINATTVEITELPINCWTQKYKEFLCSIILSYQLTSNGTVAAAATSAKHKRSAAATSAKHKTTTATTTAPSYTTSYIYCGNPILKDYRELHADNKVRFVLTLDPAYITFALSTFADKKTEYISVFEKMFKLTTHISCKNTLNLYNEHNKLSHFTNVEDILRHYYSVRLALYHERLTLMQQELNHQTQLISIKARFIQDIIAGNINLNNQPRAYIISQLITLEYPTMLNNTLIPPLLVTDSDSDRYGAGGDCAPPCSPADADSTEEKRGSYNYLIQLPLSSLTSEKVAELLAEKDYLQLKLAELKGRTPQYLWKDDLKILEQQYANFMAEYCSDMNIFMPPTTKSKHIKLSRAT
jgi:DNA topoisomerase-2